MSSVQRPAATRNQVASAYDESQARAFEEFRPESEHRSLSVALYVKATGRIFPLPIPCSWECDDCRQMFVARAGSRVEYALVNVNEGRRVWVGRVIARTRTERRRLSARLRERATTRDAEFFIEWGRDGLHTVVSSHDLGEGRRGPRGGRPTSGLWLEVDKVERMIRSRVEKRSVGRLTFSARWKRPPWTSQLGRAGTRRLTRELDAAVDEFNGWVRVEFGFTVPVVVGRELPTGLPELARQELKGRVQRALAERLKTPDMDAIEAIPV